MGASDIGHATADPNPSLVQLWAEEHGQDIRILRVALKRAHPDKWRSLKDWRDLLELRGEREAEAIADLDKWWQAAEEGDG